MHTSAPDAAPYRHILAHTPDALIFADPQGVIRVWNPGAEAVFGFSAAEALGLGSAWTSSSPSACAPRTGRAFTAP